ncbi:Oligopeptide transport ATP-binding protein OppD [Planctomycetes bacterium Pan216]|uniref:Oligopeptide transport ATP-binding protein OppD n=1 Tax=Kolteria novifilia TaxID=2527975 RepID=A0A518B264_9BACT|nr:Oligopeptide transport ATP-binding protein OppD [Planctomycetes bacterium Pan216]
MTDTLLEVRNLRTSFPTRDGIVRAVSGIDLTVARGASIGIVGESGSGKSVTNLTIMGLVPSPPAVIEADAISFEGVDLLTMRESRRRHLRGNRMAMIFQDPMTSLNPFLRIGEQLTEPLLVHGKASRRAAKDRAMTLLREVGIPDAERCMRAYPHQFSGGMRQRVMIAMALTCEPALLIADEPTTALDVTIQAQILEQMQRIRQEHGTAIVLITHDLGVAAGFCDEIHVMYAGKIVEEAATDDLFAQPRHPYTEALLRSVPRLDDETKAEFLPIRGAPPDLSQLPPGCSFAPRCDYRLDRCERVEPMLEPVEGRDSRRKSCHVDITRTQPVAANSTEESVP